MRHLVNLLDLSKDDVLDIFERTAALKAEVTSSTRRPLLSQRVLVQLYEKPSLRTRVSFASAINQLGGSNQFMSAADAGLQGREALADVARVLSSYADLIVLRTFSHQLIEDFASHARCPVINGLSDESHPCQALSDLFTMQEICGTLQGRTLAYLGDGNNVATSLAEICALLGVRFAIGAPAGFQLPESFLTELRTRFPSATLFQTDDPHEAVRDADVVYTDVWASMGQEAEKPQREKAFAAYQVNAALLQSGGQNARFMHCLPARRGLEVTDEVMESPASCVFTQAENRMHLAKGLFTWLLDVPTV